MYAQCLSIDTPHCQYCNNLLIENQHIEHIRCSLIVTVNTFLCLETGNSPGIPLGRLASIAWHFGKTEWLQNQIRLRHNHYLILKSPFNIALSRTDFWSRTVYYATRTIRMLTSVNITTVNRKRGFPVSIPHRNLWNIQYNPFCAIVTDRSSMYACCIQRARYCTSYS